MKLITKANIFILTVILIFILLFKFVLFKRVINALILTGDEINFTLHKVSVNIVNNVLKNLSEVDKIKLLLTTENLFTHHKHFIIDSNGNNILTIKKDKVKKIKNKIFPKINYYLKELNNLDNKDFFIKDKNLYLSIFKVKNIGYLCILTPKKDIKQLVFKNLKFIVLSNILIIFLFFILIGILLTKLIYREINKLHKGIVEIKKGNLDFKFKLKGSKEFVEIFQTINEITSNLKQTIKNLTNEKMLSEQYFEIAESIMLVLDENANIVKINKKACDILGYEKKELLGKNWIENFIPKESRKEILSIFNSIIKNKNSEKDFKNFENKIITKNGERIIYWHNSVIKNENKKNIGVLSSGFDITDIRKIEEEQLKILKLESLGLLAGGIAHDFNNLLSSISMSVELAKIYEDQEKIKENLLRIEKVIERSKFLTNQLLTFSKGGEPIKKEESIENIIKDTAEFILSGSPIKIEYYFQKNLWHVNIDKGQISQVIQNILINAKESISGFGTIKIFCENIKLEKNKKNIKYVLIKISDTGCGIPKKFLNKIFDPYFTTKKKGNGLGLSICYSIIKKHNGYIEVDSTVGIGTTFKIYLPAIEKKSTFNHISTLNRENNYKKLNILILEDQPDIAKPLKEFFEHLGHSVVLTDKGEIAVKLCKEKNFDVCILDLTIPGGLGGLEAGKKILKINPHAKIILASGYSTEDVMINYRKYGFFGILKKPFSVKEIKKLLENL